MIPEGVTTHNLCTAVWEEATQHRTKSREGVLIDVLQETHGFSVTGMEHKWGRGLVGKRTGGSRGGVGVRTAPTRASMRGG